MANSPDNPREKMFKKKKKPFWSFPSVADKTLPMKWYSLSLDGGLGCLSLFFLFKLVFNSSICLRREKNAWWWVLECTLILLMTPHCMVGKTGLQINLFFFFCGSNTWEIRPGKQRYMKSAWRQETGISYDFMLFLIRKHIGSKC